MPDYVSTSFTATWFGSFLISQFLHRNCEEYYVFIINKLISNLISMFDLNSTFLPIDKPI